MTLTQKDLKQIRKLYKVTPKEITIILGLGANTWYGYEKDIKKFNKMSLSKQTLIVSIMDVKTFYWFIKNHVPEVNINKIGKTAFNKILINAEILVTHMNKALKKIESEINLFLFSSQTVNIDTSPFVEKYIKTSFDRKQIPSELPIVKEFKGQCLGVGLSKRTPIDNHIMVNILTEDDGNWWIANRFSSAWLSELLSKLHDATNYIKTQDLDLYAKRQYGYKFKKAKK